VAIIVDASSSVDDTELDQSIAFAKDTVAAFADQSLFENGGTASYAQFASVASPGETFTSQLDFDNHVDTLPRIEGGTRIDLGVAEGRRLLAAAPEATASFMVVITDGSGGDPTVRFCCVANSVGSVRSLRLYDPFGTQRKGANRVTRGPP